MFRPVYRFPRVTPMPSSHLVSLKLPPAVYSALCEEADAAGLSPALMVKRIVEERYQEPFVASNTTPSTPRKRAGKQREPYKLEGGWPKEPLPAPEEKSREGRF